MGQVIRTGRDMDSNGDLDEDSTDSITENVSGYFEEVGGEWVHQTTTKQWLDDGSATPTIMSVDKSVLGLPFPESRRTDVHGDLTISQTGIVAGVMTETVDLPFSDTDIVRIRSQDRLISENSPTVAASTGYMYDCLGRLTEITGPHGEVTRINYESGSYRRKMVAPPVGPMTQYVYGPNGQPGAGQVSDIITRDRNGGSELSRITYSYNKRGQMRMALF